MTSDARAPGTESRLQRVRTYLELVRFSHTLFALPFAAMALFLAAPEGRPSLRVTGLVLVCMVAARTAAMAYNRLVDRDVDALNPRTRNRHMPLGAVGVTEVVGLISIAAAVFVTATWFLNAWAFRMSIPVLVVLFAYSHTKRFTALSHLALGLALGLSPLGVWIAVRGTIDASIVAPAMLGAAVLAWVAGFDVLYACQDVDFDRRHGLHSLPARLGVARALIVARVLHVIMIGALLWLARISGLGPIYLAGVAMTAILLAYEHSLVRANDLSKVNVAFFTVNGCVSLLLAACTILEVLT